MYSSIPNAQWERGSLPCTVITLIITQDREFRVARGSPRVLGAAIDAEIEQIALVQRLEATTVNVAIKPAAEQIAKLEWVAVPD